MNPMKCIAAYYGYYESPSKIWGLDFRFGELPQPAVRAFKDLKERFQWISSNPNETYGDCYALWPVDQDQVLAVRFRDMGRDQVQDRLHPIRIEVALVTREMCPNWPIGLATMLSAVAWEASNTVNDPTYIQLNSSVEPPQISDKILEALSSRKIPSVFYSTHTNGAPNSNQDGFDIIQMPSREIVKRTLVDHVINKPSINPDQSTSLRRSVIYYVLGLLTSNALGFTIGAISIHFGSLQPTINKLNTANQNLYLIQAELKSEQNKKEQSDAELKKYKDPGLIWLDIKDIYNRRNKKDFQGPESINQGDVISSIEMMYGPKISDKDKKITELRKALRELITSSKPLINGVTEIIYEGNSNNSNGTTKIRVIHEVRLKDLKTKTVDSFKESLRKSEGVLGPN